MVEGFKNTDAGIIPIDWDAPILSEIADFENGKAHEQFIDDKGDYIVVNSKFISQDGRVAKYSKANLSPLAKGDIAIVMSDIPNGKALAKCFSVDKENRYTLNQRIGCIKPFEEIDNDYLFYKLNRNKYFLAFDSGSGQTNLKKSEILACPVALPPTKTEQTAIATAIKDADKLITQLEKLLTKKRNIKTGAMQDLLKPKPDWTEKTFDEIADKKVKWSITGGPFGSNLKASDYTENGIRVIQLQNIGDGKFINTSEVFTSIEKANELLSCNIYPDEIILSKMGDPVARACLIPRLHSRYLMCSDGIRLVVDKSEHDVQFIFLYINSPVFRNQAEAASTGTTRKRIGLTELKALKLFCPKKTEQTRIAKILSDLEMEIQELEKRLEKQKMMKQGIMQSLLTGKIRLTNS